MEQRSAGGLVQDAVVGFGEVDLAPCGERLVVRVRLEFCHSGHDANLAPLPSRDKRQRVEEGAVSGANDERRDGDGP